MIDEGENNVSKASSLFSPLPIFFMVIVNKRGEVTVPNEIIVVCDADYLLTVFNKTSGSSYTFAKKIRKTSKGTIISFRKEKKIIQSGHLLDIQIIGRYLPNLMEPISHTRKQISPSSPFSGFYGLVFLYERDHQLYSHTTKKAGPLSADNYTEDAHSYLFEAFTYLKEKGSNLEHEHLSFCDVQKYQSFCAIRYIGTKRKICTAELLSHFPSKNLKRDYETIIPFCFIILTFEPYIHIFFTPSIQAQIYAFLQRFSCPNAYSPTHLKDFSKKLNSEAHKQFDVFSHNRRKINRLSDIRFFYSIKAEYQRVARILHELLVNQNQARFNDVISLLVEEGVNLDEAQKEAMLAISWLYSQRAIIVKTYDDEKIIEEVTL